MYLQNELIANQRKKEIEEIAKEAWKQNYTTQSYKSLLQVLLALLNL